MAGCWLYILPILLLKVKLKVPLISPDDHFDWVHSDAQPFVVWDDKRHAAAAVGHLCVEVNPLA